ncbi:MAG: hypothetical protein SCK28_11650, partial [Bacillota bacterium]|nr:hypothetical protein [Bacillota bacterium]
EWLSHHNFNQLVVSTKADKIAKGKWQHHAAVIKKELKLPARVPIILFSAETGQGTNEVYQWLEKSIASQTDSAIIDSDIEE